MCKYCEGDLYNKKYLYEDKYGDNTAFINDENEIYVSIREEEYIDEMKFKINYCPMCGRKLGE